MKVLTVNNVQQALPEACRLMVLAGVLRQTRNGLAKQLPYPLTTVYLKPAQRVLFWAERDANPFFHFFECFWMLAGRRDVKWLSWFNSKIHQYSDDGVNFEGAYGDRWRIHFGFDQLHVIATNLLRDRDCRRQVLTMWEPGDLVKHYSKDVPCNTNAYFQRNVDGALDLMVVNRSNDLIWGAYGANAVHFSFLLELMAAWTGIPMGRYYQVSMNTHLYERHSSLAEVLAGRAPRLPGGKLSDHDPYAMNGLKPYPICLNTSADAWHADLENFINRRSGIYNNPFFLHVAEPLYRAWNIFKTKQGVAGRIDDALELTSECAAPDWRKAATEWLQRRQ